MDPENPLLNVKMSPVEVTMFIAAGAVAVGLGGWLTGSGDPATVVTRAREIVAALAAVEQPV